VLSRNYAKGENISMETRTHSDSDVGFPVPSYKFDQKNEMFRRALWDEHFTGLWDQFFDVKYRNKPGWQKLDYAALTAAWNVENGFAQGCSRSNFGLYSWEDRNPDVDRLAKIGDPVKGPPSEMARWVKKAARHFGADLVGISKVHPNWVYSHEYTRNTREYFPIRLPDGLETAIVMAVAMDYDTIRSESVVLQSTTVAKAYSTMAFVANLVAGFVRTLGYRAIPAGNSLTLSIPLAMAAGLGESSRMGLLITETHGPLVRICKVLTDMPLACDTYRPFGVTEFCKTCKTCAQVCPSQAIPHGGQTTEGPSRSNHSEILKWYLNSEKCLSHWAKMHVDCSQCVRVCPFNKPPGMIHDLTRFFIKRTTRLNRLFVWLDRTMGYQKRLPVKRFWGED
jgi:reductive dehalogenase